MVRLVDRIALRAELLRPLPGELGERVLDEHHPRLVVGLAALQRAVPGVRDELRVEGQPVAVHVEFLRGRGHTLPGLHGPRDELRHRGGTLDGRDGRRILGRGVDTGEQLADAREHDARLAERRQNGFDVLQERARRPDDEHAGVAQPLAVRVQQVGRKVQGNRRLAGAGPALDDKNPLQVGPDDAVLLGLDRRDDVGHATGSLGGERREQRPLPLELEPCLAQQLGVEDLVLDPGDAAPGGDQVATGPRSERVRRGRLVERARLRNPPVEQHRLEVGVSQPDPADVAVDVAVGVVGCGGLQLDPPEGETLVHLAKLHDAVLVDSRERVALGATLVVASDVLPAHLAELHRRQILQFIEARVEACDVLPLAFQFAISHDSHLPNSSMQVYVHRSGASDQHPFSPRFPRRRARAGRVACRARAPAARARGWAVARRGRVGLL